MRLENGSDPLLKQFICRNENLNRSTSKNGQIALKGTFNDLRLKQKRKLVRDSYDCVSLGTSLSNGEEEKQEQCKLELMEYYKLEVRDLDKVYSTMEATHPLQTAEYLFAWIGHF